jgi:hypothetical protein
MTNGVLTAGPVALLDGVTCAALAPWLAKTLTTMGETPAPEALDGLRTIAKAAELYRAEMRHGVTETPDGISVLEAAAVRGLGPAAIRRALREGRLGGWRGSDGRWVVDVAHVTGSGMPG